MTDSHETCWTAIEAAALGDAVERESFAVRYTPIIRAYLSSRWAGTSGLAAEVDDATQEAFLECFRPGGALSRVDRTQGSGFRAYLYGVVRNVARRVEAERSRGRLARRLETAANQEPLPASEESLSRVFDREWARAVMQRARARQSEVAHEKGPEAERRLEILRLRFEEDLPIRAIAERLQMEAALVHHQYAQAREEFRRALLDVLGFYFPGEPQAAAKECAFLLGLLS